MSAAKQPSQGADANGHTHPHATRAKHVKPSLPAAAPPNWFSDYPPGESQAARVRWRLRVNSDARNATLLIGGDIFPCVSLIRTLEELKSLHDHLREKAADFREEHVFTNLQPQPAFFFDSGCLTPCSDKRKWNSSHLRRLEVCPAHALAVVIVHGEAASGEQFTARLPVETAEALAHDVARTIARLEGRTPLWP